MSRTPDGQALVDAGLRLVEHGLVTRTWGNLSIRIDDEHFLITPSGRAYEQLRAEDMVRVHIDSLEHSGPIKPSSEKGLHAAFYATDRDVRAVIHTHQSAASVVAAARADVPVDGEDMKRYFGDLIPTAPYALPSTKPLAKGVRKLLLKHRHRAILLANHGAALAAPDLDGAVQLALKLEEVCEAYIQEGFQRASGLRNTDVATMCDYYVKKARA